MCITKEQYATDFDQRYYILERPKEVFQSHKEVPKKLSTDANCKLRIFSILYGKNKSMIPTSKPLPKPAIMETHHVLEGLAPFFV
jgi:hypothetical protein